MSFEIEFAVTLPGDRTVSHIVFDMDETGNIEAVFFGDKWHQDGNLIELMRLVVGEREVNKAFSHRLNQWESEGRPFRGAI